MRSRFTTLFFFSFILLIPFTPGFAQNGSEAIYRDIRKLGVLANVLYVAAHPDDENTRLISYLITRMMKTPA